MTKPHILAGLHCAVAAAAVFAAISAHAQAVPELLYYKFNEASGSTTANLASPGVGSNPATIAGYTLGTGGQFGGGLQGAAGTATTNYVDTGWPTALGTGSWTLSFWLDNRNIAPTTTLQYFCCDVSAGSLRIFTNGVAGAGNLLLRGPLADVLITGGASSTAPTAVAWVYDSTVPEIRAYLNGSLVNTVPQSPLTINGTSGTFRFAAYSSNAGLMPNGIIDEFRLYNRALSAAEISATWNADLGATPVELSAFSAD